MNKHTTAALFRRLDALYLDFQSCGIYTDKELRAETLKEIREVQDELRNRHKPLMQLALFAK